MRVVVAHNFYASTSPSGENRVVEQEVEALVRAGVEVIPLMRHSDEIAGLRLSEKARLPLAPVHSSSTVRQLQAIIRASAPDVIHLHNPYPLLSPAVVNAAQRAGIAVVQTIHNFRHRCMAAFLFRDGSQCRQCLGGLGPLPGVIHGCYRGSRAQSSVMAATLAVHRRLWRRLDAYVALTPQMADFLIEEVGAPAAAVAVKPNTAPDPGAVATGGSGFLFVGRLSPEKGVDLLCEAWTQVPWGTATLTVAGDGPLRTKVEELARRRSDVVYVGALDAAATLRARRAAAVIIVPSVWPEVCPLVVLEALASARGVLATDVGGLPWLVNGGGWVVEPKADAIAHGITEIAGDPAGLRLTQAAARNRYEDEFAESTTSDRLLAIYELAIARRRAAGSGSS